MICMTTPIQKIYNAAQECKFGYIDEGLYLDTAVGFNFLTNFEIDLISKGPKDVPVSAVACLTRNDFIKGKAKTWREAALCNHGDDWGPEVFHYFENDLFGKNFPAPNSLHELKLQSIGGLVNCVNGTHRLVAAKAWLLSTKGETAIFKQANIERYRLDPLIEQVLQAALNNNEEIAFSFVESNERDDLTINNEYIRYILRIGHDEFYARTKTCLHYLKKKFHASDFIATFSSDKKRWAVKIGKSCHHY